MNGHEVAGSPFPVFVSISPTQLGTPVNVIYTLMKKPYVVAINSVGEVIVTGSRHIELFDCKGKRLLKSELSEYGIDIPSGVAFDSTDSIFITEFKKHKIVKLSKDMSVLKVCSGEQASTSYGMAVVGDKIMVCDCKKKCIHVYSTELEYAQQIGPSDKDSEKFNCI